MAPLYKRGRQYWISCYVSGDLVQRSLRTTNERIARAKKRQLAYDLALGDLHVASKTPLPSILEAFCQDEVLPVVKTRFLAWVSATPKRMGSQFSLSD